MSFTYLHCNSVMQTKQAEVFKGEEKVNGAEVYFGVARI